MSFEVTQVRQIMVLAPNIFENFYLLITGVKKLAPEFRTDTMRKLVIFLLIADVPKLIQEYLMHYLEFPTWPYSKERIFRWR